MPHDTAEIIFNDTNTKNNKDLYKFFKRNHRTLIHKTQIGFRFKVVRSGEIPTLHKKGIFRLPAMLFKGTPVIGADKIIAYLNQRSKQSKSTASLKTPEESIQDHWNKVMGVSIGHDGKFVIPQDDEISDSSQLAAKAAQEMDRRNALMGGKPGMNRPFQNVSSRDTVGSSPSYVQTAVNQPGQRPSMVPPTQDPGDPVATLNQMARTGQGSKDDELMRIMLEKMGGDEFSPG